MYGGTKQEMERLIKDAHRLDKSIKANDMSFGNIVKAIHVVQEKMGILGTTSKEAAETISGSVNSMKSAWHNLIVGIGDENADFESLIKNFIESAKAAADNIVPRISQITKGIVKAFSSLLPEIIEIGGEIIINLALGIIESLPDLVPALLKVVAKIIETLFNNYEKIAEAGAMLLTSLIVGILRGIEKMAETGVKLVENLKKGISDKWTHFEDWLYDIIRNLLNKITDWISNVKKIGSKIVENIKQGIKDAWEGFKSWFKDLWEAFVNNVTDVISNITAIGEKIVENIKQGISNAWEGLKNWFNGLWENLFGTRTVSVNTNVPNGYHKNGLDYVPFDNYRAVLHRGERVLTAEENRRYNEKQGSGMTINQYIQTVPQTPSELEATASVYLERIKWA